MTSSGNRCMCDSWHRMKGCSEEQCGVVQSSVEQCI